MMQTAPTLNQIQSYLQQHALDGWLLYDFRGQNPIAQAVVNRLGAGLASVGTRRWFVWIPSRGTPRWLIHAIETANFANVKPSLVSEQIIYVGWQDLQEKLVALLGGEKETPRIAMEYSPGNAIPYVSKLDAGTKEFIEAATRAEIVSSADLVQLVQAVLTDAQQASHRRAAAECLRIKDAAFALIGERLRRDERVTEYDVQRFILDEFAAENLDPDHPPIVAVNRHAAMPHYAPTAAQHEIIQPGDFVLIDLWAREQNSPGDCFSDITWTGFCGDVAPPAVQAIFDTVAGARDAAVAFMQQKLGAGEPVHGYEVDDVARAVIVDAGYGEGVIGRTGHSLGSAVHFNGVNIDNLETQDRRQLIPGVMFTIEPGIYLPDLRWGDGERQIGLGIRSEINCIARENEIEVTTLPRQTQILPLLA